MMREEQVALLGLRALHDGAIVDFREAREQRLRAILRYAEAHCEYYRGMFAQCGFDPGRPMDLHRIPLLDKAAIRRNYEDLLSDEADILSFYRMNTGGSTGEPLEFVVSPHLDRVHQAFHFETMGCSPDDVIVAFDGSSVSAELRRRNTYWIETGRDIPYGRKSFSSLYLSSETVQHYVAHLLELAPAIIRGYPSALNEVAHYILSLGIALPFRVKGIQLTAENAHADQIEAIARAFRTRVFLQYGHSEVSVFAYTTDETFEYTCSPFYGVTEVLGLDGRPAEAGGIGEIVVTGFFNFVMPFIRYRTGDLAVFLGDEHGVVRLGKVVGRTQDVIVTAAGERVSLTALIFGQHYHAFRNIRRWQLQQDTPGCVLLRIVRGEGFVDADEDEIRNKFYEICRVETTFEYPEEIGLTARGKFSFLIQKLPSVCRDGTGAVEGSVGKQGSGEASRMSSS